MKTLLLITFFLLLMFQIRSDNRVRVWERIEKYKVENAIYDFLNTHDIHNCFKFIENEYTLLLKCWKYDQLVEASFQINNYNNKQILYIEEYESVYI